MSVRLKRAASKTGCPTAVLTALICCGCGNVGDPLYPSLNMPMPPQNVTVVERGANLEIGFVISPLTTDGIALKRLSAVDINAGGQVTRVERDQTGAAQAQIPVDGLGGRDITVEVRAVTAKGRASQWSAPVRLHVETPLATPQDLRASAAPDGVRLTWSANGENEFRVTRRDGQHPAGAVIGTAKTSEYTDKTAAFGTHYEYAVQAIKGAAESEPTASVSIKPVDTFPPAPPAGLSASAVAGSIELTWERNTEPDFKGYRVYRATAGGAFASIATDVPAPAYSDHDVKAGTLYRYRVTAVDQVGNESAPGATVEVQAK